MSDSSTLRFPTPDSVQVFARTCMDSAGLTDWCFGWDRAVRRLGCCHYAKRRITLSRHFVARFLHENPLLICHTLLHEIAHALAYIHCKETGHGRFWKQFCTQLGIPNEKARCKCPDFAPQHRPAPTYRYALCHAETGEVFYRYQRRPRFTSRKLSQTYIVGRKDETLGKLTIVRL
ncbi:MAG: SprT-like domain-containing protein [Akkermansia sp.]|nr:SprT-like domain-containing protein [Akkermansia sp.]